MSRGRPLPLAWTLAALLPVASIVGLAAVLLTAAAGAGGTEDPAPAVSARAAALHKGSLVVDTHVDTIQRVMLGGYDLGRRNTVGHLDIPRMREGGLGAVFFSVWVYPAGDGPWAAKQTMRQIDAVKQQVAKFPKDLALARNAGDIERARRDGRIAALLGIEGGHSIDDDLGLLRLYKELGVTYMTLTWSNPTRWADSSGKVARDRVKAPDGLSDEGRAVVREMNRIGMVVDVSHVSDKTFFDALATTRKPVIASHSSCRAICPVPRNMSDDMLRALGKNGGVVGINYYSGFLDPTYKARDKDRPPPDLSKYAHDPDGALVAGYQHFAQPSTTLPAPFALLIDHIDHAIKVAGIDHVGLGSDFDGIDNPPRGMEDVSHLPAITGALLDRGYSEADVRKVLGGNFLRVIREVTGS